MILKDLQWFRPDGTDIGFEIWDDWSQTCPEKYPGIEPLERQWASFGRSDRPDKLTLATLFLYAQEGGYLATPQNHEEVNEAASNFNGATVMPNGLSDPQSPPIQFTPLDLIDAGDLLKVPAPPRTWLIDRWVPAEEVTMLAGDGGTGKSTLVLQLAIALVGNKDWLGLQAQPANVLYVSAEDAKNEIHWRLEKINEHFGVPNESLHKFKIADLSQEDPAMALFGRDGALKRTAMFDRIESAAKAHNAGCIILDAAADVFGGQEIDRREVRTFIGALRALAMRLPAAILFLAHPSVDALKTDRGYSGSTHWNNAVRSRLLFKKLKSEFGEPINSDIRVLELAKSNRALAGEQIHMTWNAGRYVVTSANAAQSEASAITENETFMACLDQVTREGRSVSPYHSPSFAPSIFAKMPKSQGLGKAGLERAMNRLLDGAKIRQETFGPPSKARHRLVKVIRE